MHDIERVLEVHLRTMDISAFGWSSRSKFADFDA